MKILNLISKWLWYVVILTCQINPYYVKSYYMYMKRNNKIKITLTKEKYN